MYTKSILRSLILDGGIAITDPVRLRDLLQEQSQSSERVNKFGTIGGGLSIGFGVLMTSLNPSPCPTCPSRIRLWWMVSRSLPV
jgi:hypothetical protein